MIPLEQSKGLIDKHLIKKLGNKAFRERFQRRGEVERRIVGVWEKVVEGKG